MCASVSWETEVKCFTITTLESHIIRDKEEWLKWRSKWSHMPKTYELVSFFGFGYTSYNQIMRQKVKPSEEIENSWTEKAKNHGIEYETVAKEKFIECMALHLNNVYVELNGDVSSMVKISDEHNWNVKMINTPDLIVSFGCKLAIVEIKCPFHGVMIKKQDRAVDSLAQHFNTEHPYGKENAFIQAALYCFTHNFDRFYTVYYFDNGSEWSMIVYKYKPVQALYNLLFLGLLNVTYHFKLKMKDNQYPLRTDSMYKRKIREYMEVCHRKTYMFIDDKCSLNKEGEK